jgi:hypothetical protein
VQSNSQQQPETYPPLQGDASVVIAMRKLGAERGWSEEELRRRAEAIRRRIQAIRVSGATVRNAGGLALTLMKTMEPEEVTEWLAKPIPQPEAAWHEGKLDRSDEERAKRRAAAEKARRQRDEDPAIVERRERIKRGAFNAEDNEAARRRVLGAQHADLPEAIERRVYRGPSSESEDE